MDKGGDSIRKKPVKSSKRRKPLSLPINAAPCFIQARLISVSEDNFASDVCQLCQKRRPLGKKGKQCKTQFGSFQKDGYLLTARPTGALSPTPLHCWGKPPRLILVSTRSQQIPAVAPPVVVGSSSLLRRSAVAICWRSAPRP